MRPNLFEYTDYRMFLQAYYAYRKAENPHFSFQVFSNNAGFPNKGFIHNVIHGIKNLAKSGIIRLTSAMKLTKSESDYFECLVYFNQSENYRERNYYFEKLKSIRPINNQGSAAKEVRANQYEFYAKWHHSAIRSIIDMYGFKDDYKWLAKMVFPRISIWQARKSVRLLLKLGLITRHKDSTYTVADKSITTGQDIVGLAIQNFHIDCTDLAKKAMTDLPRDERNVTGLTLGISSETYNRICNETLEFQKKIMDIANEDKKANRVYQFNFHLFPMSNGNSLKG